MTSDSSAQQPGLGTRGYVPQSHRLSHILITLPDSCPTSRNTTGPAFAAMVCQYYYLLPYLDYGVPSAEPIPQDTVLDPRQHQVPRGARMSLSSGRGAGVRQPMIPCRIGFWQVPEQVRGLVLFENRLRHPQSEWWTDCAIIDYRQYLLSSAGK